MLDEVLVQVPTDALMAEICPSRNQMDVRRAVMGDDAEQIADDLRTIPGNQPGGHELMEPIGIVVAAEVPVSPKVLLRTEQELSHLTGVYFVERADAQLLRIESLVYGHCAS